MDKAQPQSASPLPRGPWPTLLLVSLGLLIAVTAFGAGMVFERVLLAGGSLWERASQIGGWNDAAASPNERGFARLAEVEDLIQEESYYRPAPEEALPTFEALGDRFGQAMILSNLGRVAALFRRALALFHESADRVGVAHVLEDCAWLLVRAGQAERGARLLGAAAAGRSADGQRLSIYHARAHEWAVGQARAALGEARFEAAFALGQATALEDASTEAVAALGDAGRAEAAEGDDEASSPAAALGLTPREMDVLRLLVEGASDRAIGEALSLSPRTVSGHVAGLLAKLGVESRAAAVAYALRHELI